MRSMHYSKRIAILFIPLLMLGALQNATMAADGIPDEQYEPPSAVNLTLAGVRFLDGVTANLPGYLAANMLPYSLETQSYKDVAFCTSIDDAICKAGAVFTYLAHLPTCLNGEDIDCVVGIYAIRPDGVRVDGVFLRGIPETLSNPWGGNQELGIPRSGADGLWSLPGVLNGSGSDTYLVIATQSGTIIKQQNVPLTQKDVSSSMIAGIVPVKVISGSYKSAYNIIETDRTSGARQLRTYPPTGLNVGVCAGVSTTECDRREAFPLDVKFGLSLRLSGEIKGWLHGRIRDPLIDYKSSSAATTITMQALPVSVPVVAAWTELVNLPAVYPDGLGNPVSSRALIGSSSGANMISLLKIWLPLVGDKAQANPTVWRFGTLPYFNLPGANACMFDSKSLAGFVSTNSTVYTAGPPLYNPVTESIDYKLVSPHFTSKGEVFKGTYNLTIRSDVARCIYKFTNAPLKATISVTDESGQASVAVESMSERDGWIYLSASGFTFSSPTVKVKLFQEAPVSTPTPTPNPTLTPTSTPTPIPIATPTPEVSSSPAVTATPEKAVSTIKPETSKKSTITCYKGKTIKKVTTMKPSCPKGYLKKRV